MPALSIFLIPIFFWFFFVRFLKTNVLLRLANSYLIDSPQPASINYAWNFGSLLAVCLVIQILTGVFLAMHYVPNIDLAFDSVEHIMRDVIGGWLIRYTHANTASFFFIFIFAHIGRGLYYGSYQAPRVLVWSIGVIILVLLIATAFLGYVLPMGQMSYWGATVITNLLSAIPGYGQELVELIWGGFSVANATLNRFFSLHFLLPFVLAALAVGHMIALHVHGSSNPNGHSSHEDRYPMGPYFLFKDLITFFAFFWILSMTVCFYPNAMGHADNYLPADPMVTPASIVPEWYLLPFYAILRSIPNKLLGVIAMFSSLLVLLVAPVADKSRNRGSSYSPAYKILWSTFLAVFLLLMGLGQEHPEDPFIGLGQVTTGIYFGIFIVFLPLIAIAENTLYDTRSPKLTTFFANK